MRKIVIYVLLIIAVVVSTSLKSSKDYHIRQLDILKINNESLFTILDTIITQENQRDYYTPALLFSINCRMVNDSVTEFQIGAFGSELVDLGNHYYKGCFEHAGHWFLVKGKEYATTVFAKTCEKKRFMFYKPAEITKSGDIVLRVIEDDSYSYWIYHLVGHKFLFKELYDPYRVSHNSIH